MKIFIVILVSLVTAFLFIHSHSNNNNQSTHVMLRFDRFFGGCEEISGKYNFNGLKVRLTNLDNIKTYYYGTPTLENITGVPYSGALNKKLNYRGLKDYYSYMVEKPGIIFKLKGKSFPLIWLSFQSPDKVKWTGSLHLYLPDDDNDLKTCVIAISN